MRCADCQRWADHSDEVVGGFRNKDIARDINRHSGRILEHGSSANAICVTKRSPEPAAARKSPDDARCNSDGANDVVPCICGVYGPFSINGNAVRVVKQRSAADAIRVAICAAARASAACECRHDACGDDNFANEVVLRICDVDVTRASGNNRIRPKEFSRSADAVGAACLRRTAATSKRYSSTRRDNNGANKVIVNVGDDEVT